MVRSESIPKNTPERGVPALFRAALQTRRILERAWDGGTAYQGITLSPDDVPSRGQCGVSSVWAARQLLTNLGVNAQFTEGKIHLGDHTDDHVWVEVHDVAEVPLVVDVTSDQYQSLHGTTVHVGQYGDDPGVSYEPIDHFDPYDIPRKKLMARYALLEQNIARLPRRFRSL
jgi:hypothetical protein